MKRVYPQDEGNYATQSEAILAALDGMEEGDTLTVHEAHCTLAIIGECCCAPREWTY